jgi:ribosomal protein S1
MTDSTQSNAPILLGALKPKDALKGTVKRIGLSGAIIDVGAEKDGLLHVSALGKEGVNQVQDVLAVGQIVEVWVRKVDSAKGELQLTMIAPLAHDWGEIKTGQRVTGKVTRLEKFGAFVDCGAERPGLIHVSELSTDYVKDPSDVVKVGEEVEAVVLEINRKKKQIHLSKKAVDAAELVPDPEPESNVPEEKPLTAMEAAFRKAQTSQDSDAEIARKSALKIGTRERRLQQEDILLRTLQTSTRK